MSESDIVLSQNLVKKLIYSYLIKKNIYTFAK